MRQDPINNLLLIVNCYIEKYHGASPSGLLNTLYLENLKKLINKCISSKCDKEKAFKIVMEGFTYFLNTGIFNDKMKEDLESKILGD